MSEEALQRIAENKKTKTLALDLSGCHLNTLPSELSECLWLTDLDLSWNFGFDDLSPLAALVNLQSIDCSDTQVADLSPWLPWSTCSPLSAPTRRSPICPRWLPWSTCNLLFAPARRSPIYPRWLPWSTCNPLSAPARRSPIYRPFLF